MAKEGHGMRRRSLIALVSVGAMVLGTTAVVANYQVTPHAKSGPHFHKLMVVRADLARGGGGGKPAPKDHTSPTKEIPVAESSIGTGKGFGRTTGTIGVPNATPEQTLENRLRSLALELR
jgi:hypothetical protein